MENIIANVMAKANHHFLTNPDINVGVSQKKDSGFSHDCILHETILNNF
jgi:hypothetical protein